MGVQGTVSVAAQGTEPYQFVLVRRKFATDNPVVGLNGNRVDPCPGRGSQSAITTTPEALADKEHFALAAVWNEPRSRLAGLAEFTERLNREWAIETGLIERLYALDRGVTELLVERGLNDASQLAMTKWKQRVRPPFVTRSFRSTKRKTFRKWRNVSRIGSNLPLKEGWRCGSRRCDGSNYRAPDPPCRWREVP